MNLSIKHVVDMLEAAKPLVIWANSAHPAYNKTYNPRALSTSDVVEFFKALMPAIEAINSDTEKFITSFEEFAEGDRHDNHS